MANTTDHLTKLICAARTARDYGYVHTGHALDRLISNERERLKLATKTGARAVADSILHSDRGDI